MQLFYIENLNPDALTYHFDKEESKHIVKVLRKTTGDTLYVTNGKGHLFHIQIEVDNEKKCQFKIIDVKYFPLTAPKLHLVVAPTKMNDRLEWFLEKATEIGIHQVSLALCDRSERKVINLERLEKIVVSAMKQSKQFHKPVMNDLNGLQNIIKNAHEPQKFIAHCENDLEKNSLKASLKPQQDAIILIGPEGDFSTKEIDLALKNGFKPISLGQTRLRTETAALVACHSFVLLNLD